MKRGRRVSRVGDKKVQESERVRETAAAAVVTDPRIEKFDFIAVSRKSAARIAFSSNSLERGFYI